MMFQRFFGPGRPFAPRPAAAAGRALYTPLIEQARRPVFYLAGRTPDTTQGRFELYTLHLALVVRRLRGEDGFAAEASQALFDAFLSGLDDGLRDMGVGDLSVPKKMRKLGEAIYGRFKSYEAALAEGAAPDALDQVIARTVYVDMPDAPVADLAAYARASDAALAATPMESVFGQPLPWPTPRFTEAAS